MKASELMRQSVRHLWDGHGGFIPAGRRECLCNCLDVELVINPQVARAHRRLRRHIHKALGDVRGLRMDTLTAWLLHVGRVPAYELLPEHVQEHRRQWAERIAQHFESKGD